MPANRRHLKTLLDWARHAACKSRWDPRRYIGAGRRKLPAIELLAASAQNMSGVCVTRLRLDENLVRFPDAKASTQLAGPPGFKGKRLEKLSAVLKIPNLLGNATASRLGTAEPTDSSYIPHPL